MEVLIFALKILAACLIIVPFLGATGCALIERWFKIKLEIISRMLEEMKAAKREEPPKKA